MADGEGGAALRQYSSTDFLYGPSLGEGRFGAVVYAELKAPASAKLDAPTGHDNGDDNEAYGAHGAHGLSPHHQKDRQRSKGYAVKIIPKSEILRHNLVQAVLLEKHILSEILTPRTGDPLPGSELFMKLFLCFNDANSLYLVLGLCAGGTLLDLVESRVMHRADDATPVMNVSWVRYYAGQILRAIEFLHQRGVIHRDISPQNIGLTFPGGEMKLGDFGSATLFVKDNAGSSQMKRWMPPGVSPAGPNDSGDFVGTADYVSPEMLHGDYDVTNQCRDHTEFPALDLWSLGCLVYHMSVGHAPFHAPSDYLAFQKVIDYANDNSKLWLGDTFIDETARELVSSLLSKDPMSRLGMQDCVIESIITWNPAAINRTEVSLLKRYQSIRDHEFFKIDKETSFWTLLEGTSFMEPPYKPTEPNWMAELHQGGTTLKSLDSSQFDL